jgi:hypothetical protein
MAYEWAAIASVVSGAVIGVSGLTSGYLIAKQQRASAEATAKAQDERRSSQALKDAKRIVYGCFLGGLIVLVC